MECEIPNAMPNLEELVIFASGVARVHLDDPVATLSPLKTLHLFGQPMMPKIHNIHLAQVSASLASRGLLLSFATSQHPLGKPLEYISGYIGRCNSCLYVRPITAQAIPIKELPYRGEQACKAVQVQGLF